MRTQRGWTLFFIGILISTFLGGAIRFLFSPEFVREWVEGIVSRTQPKFTFEFNEARLSLGRGIFPQLAVEFSGLNIRAKDPCITGAIISIDSVTVPLSIRDLMERRVRFGTIEASRVDLYGRPARCESPESARLVVEANPGLTDEITPLERFFERRWNKEVVNTTRFVRELKVEEFRYFQLRRDQFGQDVMEPDAELEPLFYLRDANLSFFAQKLEAQLHFKFWPGKQMAADQPFGPTETAIRITQDEVSWTAHGNLKEGQIRVEGRWFVDRGRYAQHIEWEDLPLTNFASLLFRWGYLETSRFSTKNEWITCRLNSEGEIRKMFENWIQVEFCQIYGDLGRARIEPTKVILADIKKTKFRLKIAELDFNRLLPALGWEDWAGVVTRWGNFKGELMFTSPHTFKAQGTLEGAEVYLGDLGLPVKRQLTSGDLAAEGDAFTARAVLSKISGEEWPPDSRLVVEWRDQGLKINVRLPTVQFSNSWPLVAAVTKTLERENAQLRDFELSIEKLPAWPWALSGRFDDSRSSFNGHGVLNSATLLQGQLTLTEGRKKIEYSVAGDLKNPKLLRRE